MEDKLYTKMENYIIKANFYPRQRFLTDFEEQAQAKFFEYEYHQEQEIQQQ